MLHTHKSHFFTFNVGERNKFAQTPLLLGVGRRGEFFTTKRRTPTPRRNGDLQGADGGSLPRRPPPAVMKRGSDEPSPRWSLTWARAPVEKPTVRGVKTPFTAAMGGMGLGGLADKPALRRQPSPRPRALRKRVYGQPYILPTRKGGWRAKPLSDGRGNGTVSVPETPVRCGRGLRSTPVCPLELLGPPWTSGTPLVPHGSLLVRGQTPN